MQSLDFPRTFRQLARCLVSNHDVRPRTPYHWRVEQELCGGQRCAAIAGTAAAAACTTYIMTQCFHFRQITKCSLLQQAEVCGGQAARGHTRGPASSSAAGAVWRWNNPGPAICCWSGVVRRQRLQESWSRWVRRGGWLSDLSTSYQDIIIDW